MLRVLATIMLCVLAGRATASSLPERLVLANVFYANETRGDAQAYARAQYHLGRPHPEVTRRKLRVAQVGFAINMGADELARDLLADIDLSQLTAADKNRLHLSLARKAYRVRDWPDFMRELSQVESDSDLFDSPVGAFLAAEQSRLKQDWPGMQRYLKRIHRSHVLHRYGQYNLATSRYVSGDETAALNTLVGLVNLKNTGVEQQAIADRSRLVLAHLSMAEQNFDRAEKWLRHIKSEGPYGAEAITALAQISLAREDYTGAAALWDYVIERMPAGPETRVAYLGLPYAVEMRSGGEDAFGEYARIAGLLRRRDTQLIEFINNIRQAGMADVISGEATAYGLELAEILSAQGPTELIDRWRRIERELSTIRRRLADLTILAGVDAEQTRRVVEASSYLRAHRYRETLADLDVKLRASHRQLDAKLTSPQLVTAGLLAEENRDHLSAVVTPAEYTTLTRLFHLQTLTFDAASRRKIQRMIGRLQYDIHTSIPGRVRERKVDVDRQLNLVAAAGNRINRIEQAAAQIDLGRGIGAQLLALESRAGALVKSTRDVLRSIDRELTAEVLQAFESHRRENDQDLVDVQLAMARIRDTQMLNAGRAP